MAYNTPYVPLIPPSKARRPPVGYGESYGLSYSGVDEPVATGNISLAERNSLLQQVSDQSLSAVGMLMRGLDTPGRAVRSAMSGNENASGQELLDSMGLLPDPESLGGYGRPLAGFAAEVATDPLTYTGIGPLGGGLTKAGRAAKAAGILDDAPRAASRAIINRGDDLGRIGRRSARFFETEFGKPLSRLTDEDLFARPLQGWRDSRRSQTLGDLLERQRDWGQEHYQKALDDLDNWFYRNGGDLSSLRGQTLSNDIRFGIGDLSVGLNLPGGGAISRNLDYLGDRARWMLPGRYLAAGFDRNVHGATDAAEQVGAKILSRADSLADATARRETNRILSMLPRWTDEATDIRMGRALRNYIERARATLGGDDLVAHDEVADAVTNFRAGTATGSQQRIGQFVDEWEKMSARYLDRSRTQGISSSALQDKFGHGYFPRVLDDAIFGVTQRPGGGRIFSTTTGDQLARKKSFHVPGATNTLIELSTDRNVAGRGRLMATDDDAADYILRRMREKESALDAAGQLPVDQARLNRINTEIADLSRQLPSATGADATRISNRINRLRQRASNPPRVAYSRQSALSLAKTLRNISDDALNRNLPIFSQHPAENIAKYISGRERALGRAGVIENMLASSATPGRASSLVGGGYTSMPQALSKLGLQSVDDGSGNLIGAADQIISRLQEIGNRLGIPEFASATADELAEISVDNRLLHRLNRIGDFYAVPEVQSKVFKALDAITSIWKASILSWPSRFTRDWLSGVFSNTVEVSNLSDLQRGYSIAKFVKQQQWNRLDYWLEAMPRYRGLTSQEARVQAFLSDLATSGVSQGRQLGDVGMEATAHASSRGVRSQHWASYAPETTVGYQVGDLLAGRHLIGDAVPLSNMAASELFNGGNWARSMAAIPRTAWNALTGVKDTQAVNPILRWAARLGDTTDSINRIAGLSGLLMQGVSLEEATKRIMAAHVDYQSLTKIEKGYLRSAIPFWSYNSRISKWVVQQLSERPGGPFTQLGLRLPKNLSEGDTRSDYVPSRISDKYGLSLENMRGIPGLSSVVNTLAPSTPDATSWLSDVDLAGIDQINMLGLKRDPTTGQIKPAASLFDTISNIAGQAHPLLKAGFEASTGQDSYTGIEKNWARNTLPVLATRLGAVDPVTGYRTAERLGYLDAALQFAVPFYSRGTQMLRRATDPRIPNANARLLQTGFNAFTGVKIENLTDDEKTRDALDRIQDLIGDDPAIRSFESTYIPQELLPAVDMRTQQLYQLDRQLRKERRGQQKLRPDRYNPMNY